MGNNKSSSSTTSPQTTTTTTTNNNIVSSSSTLSPNNNSQITQLGRLEFIEDKYGTQTIGEIIEIDNTLQQNNTLQQQESADSVIGNVREMAGGRSHALVISGNKLYALGWNNYNQLGFPSLTKYVTRLKEIPLDTFNTQNTQKKITKINHVACGWFHSIVIVNDNQIYCAGHSYFNQTFGVSQCDSFKRSTQFDHYLIPIDNMSQNDYNNLVDNNVYNDDNYKKITHLSCTTFSSSFVVNGWQIFSCGEMTIVTNTVTVPMVSTLQNGLQNTLQKNTTTLQQASGCEIFKENKIKYFKHTDKGIVILTNKGKLFIANNANGFHLVKENIVNFTAGHLYDKFYFTKDDNQPIIYTSDFSFSENEKIMAGEKIIEKYGKKNLQIHCGYYNFFIIENFTKLYQVTGNSLTLLLDLQKNTLQNTLQDYFIKGMVTCSDCNYVICCKVGETKCLEYFWKNLVKNEKGDIDFIF
ncbi:hypothetical protein ABK040_003947 [Willaertia magna]